MDGWMGGAELQQFPRPANGPNLWRLTLVALPPTDDYSDEWDI